MNRILRHTFGVLLAAVAIGAGATPAKAAFVQVAAGTLTTTSLNNIESYSLGNQNAILTGAGISFGERFAGQTLSFSGDFDVLTGTPTNPLTLVAGAAGRNLEVLAFGGGRVLTGLGNVGSPNFNAIGEGAVSVYFTNNQTQIGFSVVGSDSGTGLVQAFRRDGSLIGSITINLSDTNYGFQAIGGDTIAGISLTNFNGGGIGFDNFRYDEAGAGVEGVPAPPAVVLFAVGLVGLAGFRRLRGKTEAVAVA